MTSVGWQDPDLCISWGEVEWYKCWMDKRQTWLTLRATDLRVASNVWVSMWSSFDQWRFGFPVTIYFRITYPDPLRASLQCWIQGEMAPIFDATNLQVIPHIIQHGNVAKIPYIPQNDATEWENIGLHCLMISVTSGADQLISSMLT